MTRLFAATAFVCAAFAWSGPWLDRPGVAAIGLAFLALSVGRGFARRSRPPTPPGWPDLASVETVAPESADDVLDRIRAY